MGVEIFLTLIEFGNDFADDLENGFGDIWKTHFLFIFETLY